jgi:hypothetical protein
MRWRMVSRTRRRCFVARSKMRGAPCRGCYRLSSTRSPSRLHFSTCRSWGDRRGAGRRSLRSLNQAWSQQSPEDGLRGALIEKRSGLRFGLYGGDGAAAGIDRSGRRGHDRLHGPRRRAQRGRLDFRGSRRRLLAQAQEVKTQPCRHLSYERLYLLAGRVGRGLNGRGV